MKESVPSERRAFAMYKNFERVFHRRFAGIDHIVCKKCKKAWLGNKLCASAILGEGNMKWDCEALAEANGEELGEKMMEDLML